MREKERNIEKKRERKNEKGREKRAKDVQVQLLSIWIQIS